MTEIQNSKRYDLEDRTQSFSRIVFSLVGNVPKSVVNLEITKQLVRSAGSIGANYIEANDSLSKKDFAMRVKICRKEAKETIYWLNLLEKIEKPEKLIHEATQLMKIFGAILEKVK